MARTKKQSMTQLATLTFAFACIEVFAAGASESEALKQLERDWSAATVRHDPSVVERLLADDYVGIDGRGIVSTKADEIQEATAPDPTALAPPLRVLAEEMTDLAVRIYGDVAIINGRTVQQTERAGVKGEVQFRRTTVWVKRGGRWQCVSFHGSRIQTPPAR
jgi:ketosteroid isomerase-like protein